MNWNKIGLQVIGNCFDPARLLGPHGEKPKAAKLVECNLEYYWKVRAAVGIDCLIIIRWVQLDQPLDNPVQRAQDWYNAHRSYILALQGERVMFEGYNEVDDSQAEPYSLYEVERARLLHLVNQGALLGNWSVGRPDIPLWAGPYAKVIAACTPRDAIGAHEYWSDTADIDNRWHCGRWTLVPQLANVYIVISEAGRDYLPDTRLGQPGYKLTCSDDVMVGDIGKYNTLASQHPKVLGVTMYQVGSNDPRWQAFDLGSLWGRVTAEYGLEQEVTPVDKTFSIDGRQMSQAQFLAHCEGLGLKGKYTKVCIHHTADPDEATWDRWGGWNYWKARLVDYYANTNGWDRGPHLFVDQVGIGLFTPLTQTGRGIGGTAAEAITRHIEIAGNFMSRVPDGMRLANAAYAAAVLLKAGGLGIEGLTYHRAMTSSGIECPGAALIAQWAWFRGLVATRLAELQGPSQADIEAAIGAEMQKGIIPLNPAAALEKKMAELGLLPASREFNIVIAGVTYVAQAGRKASERDRQYGVYCRAGDWGNVHVFSRVN